ncbi:MAG: thiamine diphosphokinase [Clostridiales bacterium]|nr:thiamine diphosphokinase [Clostridiales bacterium]
MKKGLIFLNGNAPSINELQGIDFRGKSVVCADGAYDYLKDYAIPDVLLGDFDSITEVPSGVTVKKFPVDKDYTDGHLAVLEMKALGVSEVEIYGAYGGRPDHEYANFALLALADSIGISAVIKGDYDIYFVTDQIKVSVEKNKTVSLLPYSDTAHIISTKGLKFCADNLTLNKLHLIGISNSAVEDEVCVNVGKGHVLLFVQRR